MINNYFPIIFIFYLLGHCNKISTWNDSLLLCTGRYIFYPLKFCFNFQYDVLTLFNSSFDMQLFPVDNEDEDENDMKMTISFLVLL